MSTDSPTTECVSPDRPSPEPPPTVAPTDRPRSVLLNTVANVAGQAWGALLSFATVPIYVGILGMEAFGLIGIYLAFRGMLRVLDLGLTPTVNREMARFRAHPERANELADFVRTFEVLIVSAGLAITVTLVTLASPVAHSWLDAQSIAEGTVRQVLLIMAVLCGLQWPVSFYHGGLMGLEAQVLYNTLRVTEVTAQHAGAILLLFLVAPSVELVFLWHIVTGVAFVAVLAVVFRGRLPSTPSPPRFRWSIVRSVWRFAAGMAAISASGLVLVNVDRIILGIATNLDVVGQYSLVVLVAGVMATLVITPVFNAIFPRFSVLHATARTSDLKDLYQLSVQAIASAILPATLALAFFGEVLVWWWSRNEQTAANVAPVLRLYVIGTACNGLMNPPYALQLAAGWTSLGVRINTVLVLLFVPAACLLVPIYEGLGCAMIWAALMLGYLAVGVPLTHRRYLRGETRGFWLGVLPALAVSLIVMLLAGTVVSGIGSLDGRVAVIVLATAMAAGGSALASARIRQRLVGRMGVLRQWRAL